MKTILFIINGANKNSSSIISHIKDYFDKKEFDIVLTERVGHAKELAFQGVKEGFKKIICAGGDGTINETANGVMQAIKALNEKERKSLRIGVIPIGTANDYIKTIGSPMTVAGLKKSITSDTYKTIDLGLVNFVSTKGENCERYFVNIVDIGIGGIVVEKLSTSSRWLGPNLTYQKAIVSSLFSYRKKEVVATGDDFNYKGKVMSLVIAKGKYFGSGLGIAPYAEPSNGRLSIVILGNISMLDYLKKLNDVKKCLPVQHPDLLYQETEEINIKVNDGKMPIDMDGEFIGYSPMQVKIVKEAFNFIV
ncbi:MAG: YegS/Rv2252/BmrU family lipid kinase [Chitinophagales bacterium]|nr:YegS/Rv2252/BmrU family lipid kinase [Chitinophagales bacterium]